MSEESFHARRLQERQEIVDGFLSRPNVPSEKRHRLIPLPRRGRRPGPSRGARRKDGLLAPDLFEGKVTRSGICDTRQNVFGCSLGRAEITDSVAICGGYLGW